MKSAGKVGKTFCYQKLFWHFTIWINCPSGFKSFANSRHLASNFKTFSRSLEQFFFTVGQNNFGNEIPFCITFVPFLQRDAKKTPYWISIIEMKIYATKFWNLNRLYVWNLICTIYQKYPQICCLSLEYVGVCISANSFRNYPFLNL